MAQRASAFIFASGKNILCLVTTRWCSKIVADLHFDSDFWPLLTNLKSLILQVAYQNLALPQSEARGREALLPSIFPPSCVSPAGKLRAVDEIARLDLTQPTAPRAPTAPLAQTDERSRSAGPRLLEISRWRRRPHRPLILARLRPRPPPPSPQRRPRPPRRGCCLS